jgi:dTDP-4-amino-4,6-dideoxygalactose transaminase
MTAMERPSIPLVDLATQYAGIKGEIAVAIDRVLEAQSFIQGEFVAAFEAEFNAAHGAAYGVGCSNGTAAILLALQALGVGAGDEVISVPNTFIATAEAIVYAGATPVFVDVDPRTHCIDPGLIEAAITPKTKAILPVHLFGNPCDMDALMAIANRHCLAVVEDCAQAHLATYRGHHVGTFGDAATFSFYPGKNLGAYGDAGHVFSRTRAHDAMVRKLIDHGRTGKYEHDVVGFNNRMDAIQAAVLSVKLRHLPRWTERRRQNAALYAKLLAGSAATIVQATEGAEPVHHLLVIELGNRDRVAAHLRAEGIASGVHYPIPLHLQPAFAALGLKKGRFPVTERAADRILSLPICGELRSEQVERIAAAVLAIAEA